MIKAEEKRRSIGGRRGRGGAERRRQRAAARVRAACAAAPRAGTHAGAARSAARTTRGLLRRRRDSGRAKPPVAAATVHGDHRLRCRHRPGRLRRKPARRTDVDQVLLGAAGEPPLFVPFPAPARADSPPRALESASAPAGLHPQKTVPHSSASRILKQLRKTSCGSR